MRGYGETPNADCLGERRDRNGMMDRRASGLTQNSDRSAIETSRSPGVALVKAGIPYPGIGTLSGGRPALGAGVVGGGSEDRVIVPVDGGAPGDQPGKKSRKGCQSRFPVWRRRRCGRRSDGPRGFHDDCLNSQRVPLVDAAISAFGDASSNSDNPCGWRSGFRAKMPGWPNLRNGCRLIPHPTERFRTTGSELSSGADWRARMKVKFWGTRG